MFCKRYHLDRICRKDNIQHVITYAWQPDLLCSAAKVYAIKKCLKVGWGGYAEMTYTNNFILYRRELGNRDIGSSVQWSTFGCKS